MHAPQRLSVTIDIDTSLKKKKTHLWPYSVHLFHDRLSQWSWKAYLSSVLLLLGDTLYSWCKPVFVAFGLLTKRVGPFEQSRQSRRGSGSPVCFRFAFICGKQPPSHRSPLPLCSPHSWLPSLPPRLVMYPILRDVFILPPIVSLATYLTSSS